MLKGFSVPLTPQGKSALVTLPPVPEIDPLKLALLLSPTVSVPKPSVTLPPVPPLSESDPMVWLKLFRSRIPGADRMTAVPVGNRLFATPI